MSPVTFSLTSEQRTSTTFTSRQEEAGVCSADRDCVLTLRSPHGLFYTLISAHVPIKFAGSVALPRGTVGAGGGEPGGLHPVLCALRLWHHSSPTFSAVWIQSVGGGGKGVRKKNCISVFWLEPLILIFYLLRRKKKGALVCVACRGQFGF